MNLMEQKKLPVKFELRPIDDIPVVQIPKKAKKKMTAAMVEAQTFAKFGVHSLRVRSNVLAALGKEADTAGIKYISHGRIIVAAEQAESAVAKLNEVATGLLESEEPNYELLLDVMRVLRELNAQVIQTAHVQMHADKHNDSQDTGKITVPYPSGQPVMIAVGKQNPSA